VGGALDRSQQNGEACIGHKAGCGSVLATPPLAEGPAVDVIEKDFWGVAAQYRFKMQVESASSIQTADPDDSIIAFQQDTADFSDSIDRYLPLADGD
jgi:hypothetical protein